MTGALEKENQRFFFGETRGQAGPPSVPTKELEKQQILKKLLTVQVQDCVSFIPEFLEYLKIKVSEFQAGRLSAYVEQWKLFTSDEFILDMVTGAHVELLSTPIQVNGSREKLFSSEDRLVIDSEIKSLSAKGVITPSVTEPGECISPIFPYL